MREEGRKEARLMGGGREGRGGGGCSGGGGGRKEEEVGVVVEEEEAGRDGGGSCGIGHIKLNRTIMIFNTEGDDDFRHPCVFCNCPEFDINMNYKRYQ